MHITDILNERETSLSFEFFPPKTDSGWETLFKAISDLEPLDPAFVSVTYGAGGSTREQTHDLVLRIQRTTQLRPIPHLTCISHTEAQIREIITRYAQEGVGNILALAGDPPENRLPHDRSSDAFSYASDLVKFIKRFNDERIHPDPRGFGIGVAGFPEGHPNSPNRLVEMDRLKSKVDAGADYIVTQLFFNNADFYDFRERCELAGITVPIIAGIMPITSLAGMKRMADLAAGVRFPGPLLKAIQRVEDDPEAVRNVGIHWATQQCLQLLDHAVRGIHFYTLNRSMATQQIYRTLGLKGGRRVA